MSDTTDSHAECGQDLHPLSSEQCSRPKGHAGPHSDATPDPVVEPIDGETAMEILEKLVQEALMAGRITANTARRVMFGLTEYTHG